MGKSSVITIHGDYSPDEVIDVANQLLREAKVGYEFDYVDIPEEGEDDGEEEYYSSDSTPTWNVVLKEKKGKKK